MDLSSYIKACYPILYIETAEEARAEFNILATCQKLGRGLTVWSYTEGFMAPNEKGDFESVDRIEDPVKALQYIQNQPPQNVFIMKDFHQFLTVPKTIRLVRDIARDFKQSNKTLIILSPVKKIPPELERDVTVLEFDLPDKEAIKLTWDSLYTCNKQSICKILGEDLSDDEQERIVNAALGLTINEAEAAFAKATVDALSAPEIPTDPKWNPTKAERKAIIDSLTPISMLVMKEKANVVKKTGILEYFDVQQTANDIGGLESLKKWLEMRSLAFSSAAREFGLPMPRGMLLVGLPGCIAEGTKIRYKRGKRTGSRSLAIEEIFAKHNNIAKGYGGGSGWDSTIPTFVQSWDDETGKMIFSEIDHVVKKGVKKCIRINTDIAGSVELTLDHPILTADGSFCEAVHLKAGDKLLVRGSMTPQQGVKIKRIQKNRVSVDSLPLWYKSGSIKKVTDKRGNIYEYKRQRRARLVIEAHMNNLSYNEYLEALRSGPEEAESLEILGSEFDVHHLDENPENDSIGNLMIMLREEHKKTHNHYDENKFNIEYTKEATVISVEDTKAYVTFDIAVKSPGPHNFSTEDGIILHNCGKSLSAKAASNILGVPLIRFDIGRVFGGLVGESEANMRLAIQTAEAVGSCVLWIDEMEKAFAGMGGSGSSDGGTGKRVFGNFITWMQEKTKPCFIIATVNNIDVLPPELLRKGRFDEIFFVGLPNEIERKAIIEIHIKKYNRDLKDFDQKILDKCVEESKDFSGAELEEAIVTGLYAAFSRVGKKQKLNTEDILAAIKETNPLAKSKKNELQAMADWAKDNALDASATLVNKKSQGRKVQLTSV